MPKSKPNKGLMKRVRVTKTGKIKRSKAFGRHLRSHKSGKLLKKYRRPAYAHRSEVRRLSQMLFIRVTSPDVSRQQDGGAADATD